MDVLVLGGEHGLLHHPQKDDAPDPELEPKNLTPVHGAGHQPAEPQDHVYSAHNRVEREKRPVRYGEIALTREK